jgi:hypothetical protein
MVLGKWHDRIGEHATGRGTQEGVSWKYVRCALWSWCCWCLLKIEKRFLHRKNTARQVVPFLDAEEVVLSILDN